MIREMANGSDQGDASTHNNGDIEFFFFFLLGSVLVLLWFDRNIQ